VLRAGAAAGEEEAARVPSSARGSPGGCSAGEAAAASTGGARPCRSVAGDGHRWGARAALRRVLREPPLRPSGVAGPGWHASMSGERERAGRGRKEEDGCRHSEDRLPSPA